MAATVPSRGKSAEDELLNSFADLIDEAAKKMTDNEFKNAAKKSNAALDRALSPRKRRSGTV